MKLKADGTGKQLASEGKKKNNIQKFGSVILIITQCAEKSIKVHFVLRKLILSRVGLRDFFVFVFVHSLLQSQYGYYQ